MLKEEMLNFLERHQHPDGFLESAVDNRELFVEALNSGWIIPLEPVQNIVGVPTVDPIIATQPVISDLPTIEGHLKYVLSTQGKEILQSHLENKE